MDLSLFRGFSGRIPRSRFWMGMLLLVIFELVVMGFLFWLGRTYGTDVSDPSLPNSFAYEMVPGSASAVLFAVVLTGAMLAVLWAAITLYAKRWHDREKSGWWSLIGLVPVIGGIWLLVELGFLRGTPGPNRFGDDPLSPAG